MCSLGILHIYPVQVVALISGNVLTIILGGINSFVINKRIKLYIHDDEKSKIEGLHNDPLPNLLCLKKKVAGAQPEIFQDRFSGIRGFLSIFKKR